MFTFFAVWVTIISKSIYKVGGRTRFFEKFGALLFKNAKKRSGKEIQMIARVQSYALFGLEGVAVTVEADVSKGLPAYEMVGLPDAAVKESRERVKSAIKNSALEALFFT